MSIPRIEQAKPKKWRPDESISTGRHSLVYCLFWSFRQKARTFLIKFTVVIVSILVSLGALAYGAFKVLSPQTARGFLSLLFMSGLMAQIFSFLK